MRNLTIPLFVVALAFIGVLPEAQGQENNPKVLKPLPSRGLEWHIKPARPIKPTVIDSAEILKTYFPREKDQKLILANVGFAKQKLLAFHWRGSGQDKLSASLKKGIVVFVYRPGRTRDLRPHHYLFAVAQDAKWTVEKNGRPGLKLPVK